ncbi:hypothetical protein ACS0TY_028625 [Phlomoides rotata]
MKNLPLISAISVFLISCLPLILSQQPYIGTATASCDSRDNSTSVLGYTCNGVQPTCRTYLTFRAQPPYNSVSSISTLLSVNSSELSQLNSVSETAILETGRMLLVPVTCSCSGGYYHVDSSYTTQQGDTYFGMANNTFQGLSTCQALQVQNIDTPANNMIVGERLTVPMRCACPTRNQSNDGVNYLLSYLVATGQFVESISNLFGVETSTTLAANSLSGTNSVINPFTTLLIPLENPPTSSQVTAPQPPPPPPVMPPLPPPVSPPSGGSSKAWIYAVVGAVGGVLLASAGGTLLYCVFFRKQRKRDEAVVPFESAEKPMKKVDPDEFDSEEFLESISSIAQSLKVYTFQEIKSATGDFSPSCLIKGSVYRGTMNGDFAAIKKMNGDVSKEINLLNKINHFNLIRLSGVSFNEGNWYLVYEHASNGSLNDWIHNKNDHHQTMLNWNKRLQIALDVAAGLNYLHRYTSPPHIHKDLNASNVLLDADFRAKIANFRLARSTEGQEGQFALTRHIVGTKGYMAPEYLENGVVSPKLDVYAFGILLLEILTGKEVSSLNTGDGPENVGHVMDPMLQGNYPEDMALVLFRMIDNCVKKDPSDRPYMDDIFQTLSRISTSSGEWAVSISDSR